MELEWLVSIYKSTFVSELKVFIIQSLGLTSMSNDKLKDRTPYYMYDTITMAGHSLIAEPFNMIC